MEFKTVKEQRKREPASAVGKVSVKVGSTWQPVSQRPSSVDLIKAECALRLSGTAEPCRNLNLRYVERSQGVKYQNVRK